jgi:hypothetical protein
MTAMTAMTAFILSLRSSYIHPLDPVKQYQAKRLCKRLR